MLSQDETMRRLKEPLAGSALLVVLLVFFSMASADAAFRYGHLVQIQQLSFDPDTGEVPGDAFAVLVIQNREEGPIQHEVRSKDLFAPGTLISVHGTGEIEYDGKRVSRVLLSPGEEVVIWYYAVKGHTYYYQCNLNGHSMQGSVQAV
jgi:uncharacterized cupredoxin-like copper-binding protein